ncbi:flagellar basal body-associated FliL family protein [Gemmatimonas aurantiaca]|nr:flagellar basal body-associated FliL family protein [Gemmatimonas aurantiaca]
MAEEDKTTIQNSGDEPEETAASGASPIKKYGIMIGIVLVMAIGGYFVTLKVIKPMLADDTTEEIADSADAEDSDSADDEAKPSRKKKKKKKKKQSGEDGDGGSVETHIFEISDIIVNPAGTGGTRFLSVSIGFELDYPETMELFEARKPQIRDALITILGSKNIEQLTDMKQKEIARMQIKKRVSHLLETDELSAIYFTNFVIQ